MDDFTTALTSRAADIYFGETSSKPFLGSTVLEAVLRYIAVKHRKGEMDSVKLLKTKYITGGYGYVTIEPGDNIIVYAPQRGDSCLSPQDFEESEEWKLLDSLPYPVSSFLSQISETKVYLKSSANQILVCVRKTIDRWVNSFASSLFMVLPWIYTKDTPVSNEEKELYRAINNHDFEKVAEIINAEVEDFDFQKEALQGKLKGWEQECYKTKIGEAKRNVIEKEMWIADKEAEIRRGYEALQELKERYKAMQLLAAGADSEGHISVYDYFASRKNLWIKEIENGSITFCILDTVEYYDEDEFDRVYNNHSSWLYANNIEEDTRKVYYEIFHNHRGVFRVESEFRLNGLRSLMAIAEVSGSFNKTHLPQPHLYHHACLGGNLTPINRYMADGDWDMAIDQAIAATKNIYFGDSIVMPEMIWDVQKAAKEKRTFIVADNGKVMTMAEFLTYLEQNPTEKTDGE